MIDEWEHSAKVLIYHYRAVLKGMVPFSASWGDEQTQKMRECNLDDKALDHIRELQLLIKDRGKVSHQIPRSLIFLINTQMPSCRRPVVRISPTLVPSRSYGSRNCMWMANPEYSPRGPSFYVGYENKWGREMWCLPDSLGHHGRLNTFLRKTPDPRGVTH